MMALCIVLKRGTYTCLWRPLAWRPLALMHLVLGRQSILAEQQCWRRMMQSGTAAIKACATVHQQMLRGAK